MKYHISLNEAVQLLQQEPNSPFTVVGKRGSLQIEYFAPKGTDTQQPHVQDELYIIVSGSGIFFRNGEKLSFTAGDVLFVPAGMVHRFENFSPDFATWVLFYGPEGGEQPV